MFICLSNCLLINYVTHCYLWLRYVFGFNTESFIYSPLITVICYPSLIFLFTSLFTCITFLSSITRFSLLNKCPNSFGIILLLFIPRISYLWVIMCIIHLFYARVLCFFSYFLSFVSVFIHLFSLFILDYLFFSYLSFISNRIILLPAFPHFIVNHFLFISSVYSCIAILIVLYLLLIFHYLHH